MTADQKVAFITAQTEMMRIESEVMRAENIECARQGQRPANGPEQWDALRKRWESVLGYNSIIEFFDR